MAGESFFAEVGCVLTLTFSTASEAYKPRELGEVIVVPQTDVKANEAGAYVIAGAAGLMRNVPKKNGVAWAQGARLYYDPTAANWNTTTGRYAGVAAAAAEQGAVVGDVILMPTSGA